jgi:hypothetical protein
MAIENSENRRIGFFYLKTMSFYQSFSAASGKKDP